MHFTNSFTIAQWNDESLYPPESVININQQEPNFEF